MTVPSPQFEQNTLLNRLLMSLGFPQLAARYRQFCSNVIWRQYHYYSMEEWKNLVSSFGFIVESSFTYDPESICLLNDFLYPFGIVGLFTKKIFNQWVLFPSLRRIVLFPLYILIKGALDDKKRTQRDGLVFLALRKGV